MFEAGYAAAAGRHGGAFAISFSARDPYSIAPAPGAGAGVEAQGQRATARLLIRRS